MLVDITITGILQSNTFLKNSPLQLSHNFWVFTSLLVYMYFSVKSQYEFWYFVTTAHPWELINWLFLFKLLLSQGVQFPLVNQVVSHLRLVPASSTDLFIFILRSLYIYVSCGALKSKSIIDNNIR